MPRIIESIGAKITCTKHCSNLAGFFLALLLAKWCCVFYCCLIEGCGGVEAHNNARVHTSLQSAP